jgi:hypothetical protein
MIVYVVDGNVRRARLTKKRLFGAVIGVPQTVCE